MAGNPPTVFPIIDVAERASQRREKTQGRGRKRSRLAPWWAPPRRARVAPEKCCKGLSDLHPIKVCSIFSFLRGAACTSPRSPPRPPDQRGAFASPTTSDRRFTTVEDVSDPLTALGTPPWPSIPIPSTRSAPGGSLHARLSAPGPTVPSPSVRVAPSHTSFVFAVSRCPDPCLTHPLLVPSTTRSSSSTRTARPPPHLSPNTAPFYHISTIPHPPVAVARSSILSSPT